MPAGSSAGRYSSASRSATSRLCLGHHALVASDGYVDVHMAELVHGLAQRAALDHEHRRVRRAQGVERHVLAVDSFPRGAELPLDRRRVQDPFRVSDRVEEHRVGIPVGTEPVDMFPDETADWCGDGHDSVAFRGLRLVEPVFAQVVRTLPSRNAVRTAACGRGRCP